MDKQAPADVRDAALEEAAKVCEALRADLSKGQGDCVNRYDCAAAIRAMKGRQA